MHFSRQILSVASYAILVTACGSGGQSEQPFSPTVSGFPGPASSPFGEPGEGIWHGSILSDTAGDSGNIVGLVDSWGWIALLTDRGQYFGIIERGDLSSGRAEMTVDLTGITAAGFTWQDSSTVAQFSFDGALSHRAEMSGDYSGAGDSGTISLTYDPASERSLDLSRTAGVWVHRDSSQNITATFEISSGVISGSDVNGCAYSGTVAADFWFSTYIYDVSLTVSNCPAVFDRDLNGDYVGPGGLTDIVAGSNLDDLFIIGISNDSQVITLALEKI